MTTYLRQGLLCLDSVEQGSFLYDLVTGEQSSLSREQAQVARSLIYGLIGERAERASTLLRDELLEDRHAPFDDLLRARLADLDEQLSWCTAPSELLDRCEQAHSLLRHSRQDLDQLPVLPETALRRAQYLRDIVPERGRVVLVGDDDLVALPAALLGLRATVIDLDPEILRLYEVLNEHWDLHIELHQLDLRSPLPEDLLDRFDAFCADPEMSRECISLFLSRGVSLVHAGGAGLIACTEEWQKLLDEALERSSVARRRILRRFNNYRDWQLKLTPYRSDLHVLALGEDSTPIVGPQQTFKGELFPFGLANAQHLIATLRDCDLEALQGERLLRALERGLDVEEVPQIVDSKPFPVRIVSVTTTHRRAQASVHADGSTVDVDISPAPETEEAAGDIMKTLVDLLGAGDVQMQALRRLE